MGRPEPSIVPAYVSALILALTVIAHAQEMALDQDSVAIRAASLAWENAAKNRDVAGALSILTDDASVIPPGKPAIVGRNAIRDFYARVFKDPAFAVAREPAKIEVAGNLAYSAGIYRRYATGRRGKTTQRGEYVLIWKKQPDNSWKIAIDIWNRN